MTNDSKVDPLTAAQQAIAGVEWGAGSEHFRYGRETMQADAISAVGALREQYPDARMLTLDAVRLISEARQAMARQLLTELGAPGVELDRAATIRLIREHGGLPTGSCSDPRHASEHPPHLAEAGGTQFWCVGGFVRADGTTPVKRQGVEW